MNKTSILSLFMAALLIGACGRKNNGSAEGQEDGAETPSSEAITAEYAKGFQVKTQPDGVMLLDINDPENIQKENFHFALVEKGKEATVPDGYEKISIPIDRAVCMTSLQLSNFIRLGETKRVVGITSTRHLQNATMKQQLKDSTTSKIGIEGNFDNEVIMALNPEIIFISPFKRGGYEAIKNVDIPMIPHLGYKELTPLGQAEWLKVVGLLTGNAAKANAEFEKIKDNYNRLKALTDTVSVRPTVFSGEIRSGNWYAVGGNSFLAQMFRDAGADYFLKDNHDSGGVTLDYETVYANAANADYWRIVNSFDGKFDYAALDQLDHRYTDFKAWKDHGVIYCNMNEVPFYESMPVEPDVVLADFIHVFHPSLLPDHKPVYYRLLK